MGLIVLRLRAGGLYDPVMATRVDITFDWVADRCLRVGLGSGAGEEEHRLVRGAYERVRAAGIAGLVDVTPGYATLVLTFDPLVLEPEAAMEAVRRAVGDGEPAGEGAPGRVVEIPVCYEGACAPDIEAVAEACGLSASEVAARHAGAEYAVRFVGFSPGFAYLAGLPRELATARLDRPRVRVPAGSVGIGGDQTGIYPLATPGGWRLIGRTPLRMFDAQREPAALLGMGDRVRLVAITAERFAAISRGEA